MAQLNGYGYLLAKGQLGQLSEFSLNQIDSYAAESAIEFGQGVIQGVNNDQVDKAEAGGTFIGVAMLDITKPQNADGQALYNIGDSVPVVTFGRVFVNCVGEAQKNQEAYLITTAGDDRGKFTSNSETADAIGPVGKFYTQGIDSIVVLEVTSALRGPQGPQGA